MSRPATTEYAPFYANYVAKAQGDDIIAVLNESRDKTLAVYSSINEQTGAFRYAEGKWSIKELLIHIIDAERVFAYRALRVGRGDQTPLASFDEDSYMANCNAENRSLEHVLAEYKLVRASTIALFEGFSEEMLLRTGTASNAVISVRALGYIIPGHETHHINIINERYLPLL